MVAAGGDELMQGQSAQEEKIYVSVRLRPLNEKEISRNDVSDWECINDNTIMYRNNLSVSERSMYPTAYTFDRVFRCDCSTRQVYEEGAKEVALSVVSGVNSSVFAYGQTSSGKTYTMSGITEYAIADIYEYIEKHTEREFILRFSAMEIYNESVRDLLSADSTPLRLLDDPERGTIVDKLTEETLRDWNHFKELLSLCEAQRQIGETSLNETSSRSHQILRLTIESSALEFLGNDKSSILTATVNFVDLAGSERASQALSAGTRLKEGCHINRSLLTLGTVIRKLSKGRNGHIPFRDSKLTRILQSSLGGSARTAIICTLSPARCHVEQSRNTLLFACCAKEVTTNAQVNVVVSDKALVKQLQRELARLESELRCSGPTSTACDSSALLREKDLQIEKLKQEVMELTMQRDLARSHVEDLLRAAREDIPPTVWQASNDQYPKLRVRNLSDSENQVSETTIFSDFHCLDCGNGVRSFHACQYSDGQSCSSDESFLQLPDFKENFPQNNPSPQLSGRVHEKNASSYQHQEENDEQNDENLEDLCKEVRCIETVDSSAYKCGDFDGSESSPTKYENSDVSSPEVNTATSGLTEIDNEDRANRGFRSPSVKEKKAHEVFSIPCPPEQSPWLLENGLSGSRSSTLTRSRSCKASLSLNENTPTIGFDKDFTGRPEGFQRKLPALRYNVNIERLSVDGSKASYGDAGIDEVRLQNFEIPKDEESAGTLKAEVTKAIDHQPEQQLADQEVQETETKVNLSLKIVKDVGLDPIEDMIESPSKWPFEFKRLQKQIIELWHACNVSLVHRTYFFLLFKGDPKDSIYMEVELRRLSFLKDTFSRGNRAVENGRNLTSTSSMKALRHERQMLTQKMRKKLSKEERENIFLKWGIGLNTSHRRLQLAHCLWSQTRDMDHIRESATIVAKLVGYDEQDQALKEMFGLNFAPRRASRKFNNWKRSVMSLL